MMLRVDVDGSLGREDECSEMEVRPDAYRRADDQRHGMRAGQVDERL
jgi:hypothetical protein